MNNQKINKCLLVHDGSIELLTKKFSFKPLLISKNPNYKGNLFGIEIWTDDSIEKGKGYLIDRPRIIIG